MKLIGIVGPAGAGKDTVGALLKEHHGYSVRALAAPIKQAICAMFGFGPAQWYDRRWKESADNFTGKSPRVLAQTLGTEWGRELVADDIWLRVMGAKWEAYQQVAKHSSLHMPGICITDVRFENEAEWVRQQPGGVVVHVVRPASLLPRVAAHASEGGVLVRGGDHIIHNDGSIRDLEDRVEQFVQDVQ